MSNTETATGSPATDASLVVRIVPDLNKATSVEVQPMSKVMMLAKPDPFADLKAPTTPPDGPDKIVRTGSRAASSAEMLPPEDCMTRSFVVLCSLCFVLCCPSHNHASRLRYRPINGCRY